MRIKHLFIQSLLVSGLAPTATAQAQTFEVDFSHPADPPLVKTKFGVYQTPLVTLPRLLDSVPLLREIKVTDLRYEIGWGKPESLAYTQIGGTAQNPTYEFSMLDAFITKLNAADVTPLLAMSYCPLPLKSRTDWSSWKDMPGDLQSWQKINREYSQHLKRVTRGAPILYEVWNEPDMTDPGGKMFFNGTAQDYEKLYAHAADGLLAGDSNAQVGGPATAWNLAYLTPILSHPITFASIHSYNNYAAQIGSLRGALSKRPELPIFMTEYASFTDFPANGPQSRSEAAMRFFRDVKGLLNYPDVTKVYWAQWLDAGDAPGMGLVTYDGHRKAIFNAFKIYGMMPVDRVTVQPDRNNEISAMASADKRHAAVVLWNETASARTVQINLRQLPFTGGTMQLYRIDKQHASYLDNSQSENLKVLKTMKFREDSALFWKGAVPAGGVVFLSLSDGTKEANGAPSPVGKYLRSYHWFPDRSTNAYADFDARTSTARLGMGDRDAATAQIGESIEHPARRWRVRVETSGTFRKQDENSLLALRLGFPDQSGQYSRSVLLHGGFYDAKRTASLPLGKGGANADQTVFVSAMKTGRAFDIDLQSLAPADWNRNRVRVTFLLHNAGRGARARFTLSKAAAPPRSFAP